MDSATALLVIDAQVNMFDEASSVFDGPALLERMRGLMAQARTAHLPIVHIQNNGPAGAPDEPGTPGWEIQPALAPRLDEVVIQKTTPDAFHETPLRTELEARNIRRLVIMGMQTDYCIAATCRRAHALGYEVTLVKDAHSTYDDGALTAPQIIARYNDELAAIANVQESSTLRF